MASAETRQILDKLNGYEFEDLMMDVFEHLDYQNVRNPGKSGDEGRDIIMEKDGTDYVVECKHIQRVGRPKVQKLHSAVSTYPGSNTVGILVTTGTFTKQARDYVEKVNKDGKSLKLMNGDDLRDKGEEIGLDLYSGKIEVLCDEVLSHPDSREDVKNYLYEQFHDIDNFSDSNVESMEFEVSLIPTLHITAKTDAVFETSVGEIHSVHEKDKIVMKAERGNPDFEDSDASELVSSDIRKTKELDEDDLKQEFDNLEIRRFGKTETDYKDQIKRRIQEKYEETVEYTGDNNVTYQKDCCPKQSDIDLESITPVYLPLIKSETDTDNYSFDYSYYTSSQGPKCKNDGIHKCCQCGNEGAIFSKFNFCRNCGSINCRFHTKTERLEQEPICTGCAQTERFFLKKKYFFDNDNLTEFREKYDKMPIHKKALENKPLLVAVALTVLVPILLSL